MNMKRLGTLLLCVSVVSITFMRCKKDAVVPEIIKPTVIPAATELNNFIWGSMHDYYLWNTNIPALTNNYYLSNKDSLNLYLNKYTDPTKLFNDLLYQYNVVDKWSFIVNDYSIIDNWIAGISKTMGYDYQLYLLSSTSDAIFGVIRYVLPGSPAEKAGLKRGDIFIKIDGTQLTTSNYQAQIAKESFALTLATFSSSTATLTPTTTTPVMVAVQMQEDPVYLTKVITVNGAKVGYIVYNGFTAEFDLKLNSAMQQFKSAGISKIIVDLRYNGGGSVNSATYMASMIYSTDVTKIFSKSIYNNILQQYFIQQYGADALLDKFTNYIPKTSTTAQTAINSLNLSEIYFIASKETASASELMINGLKPYMNVVVVGGNTYGKYVGSFTIKDYDNAGNLVTTHKYAMQPITVKIANSAGVTDYVNGLTPDVSVKEDVGNLLPFGDENEVMLKACLDRIKGLKSAAVTPPSRLGNSKYIFGSKEQNRFAHDMYLDSRNFNLRIR